MFRREERLVGDMAHTRQIPSRFESACAFKRSLRCPIQRRPELTSASFDLPEASPRARPCHFVAIPLQCALGSNASCIAAAALSVSPVVWTHGAFGQDRRVIQCSRSWQGSRSRVSTPAWLLIGFLDHASPRGSWHICDTGT